MIASDTRGEARARRLVAVVAAAYLVFTDAALAPAQPSSGNSHEKGSAAPYVELESEAAGGALHGRDENRCKNPLRMDGHPVDEGILAGYKLDDFSPEPRDLFWQMDQVADEEGTLHPLDFDTRLQADRSAIYGRNTWIMWCAGNEGFWNWLAQDGYGFLDFLHVIDSRKRGQRFQDFGLVNQPGMKASTGSGPWGLYLDVVDAPLQARPGADDYGAEPYVDYATPKYDSQPDPRDRSLKSDGVNPVVYGYPTGVVGMRLFPNPCFDEKAQRLWNAEAFYDDPDYARNPRVVRPFRVGVSCAFCHVAPHPLNPPTDPENPKWENLSSIIGNQYFRTSAVTGSRASRGNFIWHVLRLAQPGTIDASLISTDHINNPNTMNAVFQVRARLARADANPAEKQGRAARLVPPSMEELAEVRRTPHILLDGSDSIGAWGALARVYLNIGTFYEEWNECHNPVLGFTEQKPFSIAVCRANSFYWQVNEQFRVGALLDFFLWQKPDEPWQSSTVPMKLVNAPGLSEEARRLLDPEENPQIEVGRRVFAGHCMICHSSKQPEGFATSFEKAPANSAWRKVRSQESGALVMPMYWEDWDDFKRSPAYRDYVARAEHFSEASDFLSDNFLSTDIRIPISLVRTSAGRPLGRNALDEWVWAEFSSDTYKQLPAVGEIDYVDPFDRQTRKFRPLAGGRGYARPATLVSVWATAPLLHNNALGMYLPDHKAAERVSTGGRVAMFEDAIEKLLWRTKRSATPSGEGGLRNVSPTTWHGADPGWVFRTDQETYITLPRGHLRQAAERTAPAIVLWFIDHPAVAPLILAALFGFAIWRRSRWIVFLACILSGVMLIGVLIITGLQYVLPWWVWGFGVVLLVIGALSMAGGNLTNQVQSRRRDGPVHIGMQQLWYEWLLAHGPSSARWLSVVFLAIALFALWQAGVLVRDTIDGKRGDLAIGPIPKGVPVNSLANIDPEASLPRKLAALRGLLSAINKISRLPREESTGPESLQVFNEQAGPGLMGASACPDLTLDGGHYFGESLRDEDKRALISFLKTL